MHFQIIGIVVAFLIASASLLRAAEPTTKPNRAELETYFAEPKGLAYDEQIMQKMQADGWHWQEFRYTSLMYEGEPIRIHAVYAAPDSASVTNKVPVMLMTHGVFGGAMQDLYLGAIGLYAKAGYAVLFFDWNKDTIKNLKPADPNAPLPYTTYGKLPQTSPEFWFEKKNDFRDQLHYQAVMAGKRGLTWLAAREETDMTRVGVTGASYGGIFSSMLAGVDTRIGAANPCVYTSGWSLGTNDPYNLIRADYTPEEAARWCSRFDSKVLLSDRNIPILYTIGSNDPTFQMTKAMHVFEAMNEPKFLLIGPNRVHDYWDVPQGILFFDHALKKSRPWPKVSDLSAQMSGPLVTASVKVESESIKAVEMYFASAYEMDPDRGPDVIPCEMWKWALVPATPDANGRYTATWKPPALPAANASERMFDWSEDGKLLPVSENDHQRPQSGAARVFSRVIDGGGAMSCSTLQSVPITFDVAPTTQPTAAGEPPVLESAVRVTKICNVKIDPNVEAGKPIATFDAPLVLKDVGTHGYALWNWRKQEPSASFAVDGVATPTKKILAPFKDAVGPKSFLGGKPWDWTSGGGLINFVINGKDAPVYVGKCTHGSVLPGTNNMEELSIEPGDDQEHRLTVVMAGSYSGHCNVRVSLANPDGATTTLRYRHTSDRDAVLQFKFKGPVKFRVQITSQAEMYTVTQVGPSAMFFD